MQKMYISSQHSQCIYLQVREINDNSEQCSSPISSVNAHELVRAHNYEEVVCFQLGQRRGPASFLNELQINLARSGPPSAWTGVNQGRQWQTAALHQGKKGPVCLRVPCCPGREPWVGQDSFVLLFLPFSTILQFITVNTSVFHSLLSV